MIDFEKLTRKQIDTIFGLVLDSEEQSKLLSDTSNENYWMLGFLFDNELLIRLEKYSEKLYLEEKLSKNNILGNIKKI